MLSLLTHRSDCDLSETREGDDRVSLIHVPVGSKNVTRDPEVDRTKGFGGENAGPVFQVLEHELQLMIHLMGCEDGVCECGCAESRFPPYFRTVCKIIDEDHGRVCDGFAEAMFEKVTLFQLVVRICLRSAAGQMTVHMDGMNGYLSEPLHPEAKVAVQLLRSGAKLTHTQLDPKERNQLTCE